jgi:signal transduction histidine kinase
MARVERRQSVAMLLVVAAIGIALLAYLDNRLLQADAAEARRSRTIVATQAMKHMIRETAQQRQILVSVAAFVAGSQEVTQAELNTYLRLSGLDRKVVPWLALIARDGGSSLFFPGSQPIPDLPAKLPPAHLPHEIVAIDESLRQIDVQDQSGHRFVLIGRINFDVIKRAAILPGWQGVYDVQVTHWIQAAPISRSLQQRPGETTLQGGFGPNRWRVTVRSLQPRPPLVSARKLLWGVGLLAIGLALGVVHQRQRTWHELQRRVQLATSGLERQNRFLNQLTAVFARALEDPQLPSALTQLLAAYLPASGVTLWLAGPEGTLSAGSNQEASPAIVAAWLGVTSCTADVATLPIGDSHARFGVLAVHLQALPSAGDRALLSILTNHLGHLLAGRQLTRQIDTERRMAARILGSLSETVLVCNKSGLIHYANATAASLFEQDHTQLPGHHTATLPLSPNPCALDAPAMTGGVAWLLRQSQRIPLRFNRAPLTDDLVVVTLRDVTAEESAATQKAAFINLASHELRTPLTIIRSQTQALGMASQLGLTPERQRQLQHSVIQQVDRMTKLVHDLLDASRLGGAGVTPSLAQTGVDAVISQALRPLEAKARQKNVTLVTALDEDLPDLRTDPHLLAAILGNLIDNAISYSPNGRTIRITARRSGDGVDIAVVDQGIGIRADDLQRLFQPFQRLESPFFYQVRGTGLGLYLSREWAKVLGATLSVSSQPGTGSTFTLHLPIQSQERRPAA